MFFSMDSSFVGRLVHSGAIISDAYKSAKGKRILKEKVKMTH